MDEARPRLLCLRLGVPLEDSSGDVEFVVGEVVRTTTFAFVLRPDVAPETTVRAALAEGVLALRPGDAFFIALRWVAEEPLDKCGFGGGKAGAAMRDNIARATMATMAPVTDATLRDFRAGRAFMCNKVPINNKSTPFGEIYCSAPPTLNSTSVIPSNVPIPRNTILNAKENARHHAAGGGNNIRASNRAKPSSPFNDGQMIPDWMIHAVICAIIVAKPQIKMRCIYPDAIRRSSRGTTFPGKPCAVDTCLPPSSSRVTTGCCLLSTQKSFRCMTACLRTRRKRLRNSPANSRRKSPSFPKQGSSWQNARRKNRHPMTVRYG
jgi:hypothetical protein